MKVTIFVKNTSKTCLQLSKMPHKRVKFRDYDKIASLIDSVFDSGNDEKINSTESVYEYTTDQDIIDALRNNRDDEKNYGDENEVEVKYDTSSASEVYLNKMISCMEKQRDSVSVHLHLDCIKQYVRYIFISSSIVFEPDGIQYRKQNNNKNK
ncbi:hypothetical protein C0J52_12027 [Blattella germanica]|nr:hypothetical protein C0J52_12027 [Blattella germanica]